MNLVHKQIKIYHKYLDILQPHMLLRICWVFIKIAFIGFGGGNAMLPVILNEIVEKRGWITEEHFDKMIILSNALPGPATIQVPAMIGYHIRGWRGAIFASIIANLPLTIVISVLTVVLQEVLPSLYLAYLSLAIMPVILALIFTLIIKMFKSSQKEITLYISLPIIIVWTIFLIVVPSPYNIPAIAIIVMIIVSLIIYQMIIKKRGKT
ncbi:MAG: chromate transporter [Mycoplasmataceae bacterium]|nr:chromate transporter [Mycoplasmataceae bacterium]